MATRRDPTAEWIDPDRFDRDTIATHRSEPAVLGFIDPHSTKPDPTSELPFPNPLPLPADPPATIGELLADAARVDPSAIDDATTIDDSTAFDDATAFGSGAFPGRGPGSTDGGDEPRLSPELLPHPRTEPTDAPEPEPPPESRLADAFADAFPDPLDASEQDLDEPFLGDDTDDLDLGNTNLDNEVELDDPAEPFG